MSSSGGIRLTDEGGIIEHAWQRFKSKEWFLILIPSHQNSFAEFMENSYFKPGTKKNAGFEITWMSEHSTILIFAKKEIMNNKDFEKLVYDYSKTYVTIPDGKDVAFLPIYNEEETKKWVNKLNFSLKIPYEEVYITTNNLKVMEEMMMFERMYRFYDSLFDYFGKQMYDE